MNPGSQASDGPELSDTKTRQENNSVLTEKLTNKCANVVIVGIPCKV